MTVRNTLANHYKAWYHIGTDTQVLDCVQDCVKFLFTSVVDSFEQHNRSFSDKEVDFNKNELNDLLSVI